MYLTMICLLLFAISMQTATEETRKKVSLLLLASVFIIEIIITIVMTIYKFTDILNDLHRLQEISKERGEVCRLYIKDI